VKKAYEKVPVRIKGLLPTIVILVIMCAFFTIVTDSFLTYKNIKNVLLQTACMSIVGVGLTFVVICGHFDLSGGSVIALIGILAAKMLLAGWNTGLVIVLVVIIGALIGLFNGLCVTRLRLVSFIVTLATSIMAGGLALAITSGKTISGMPENFLWFGSGKVGGFPVAAILMLLLCVVFHFVLSRTVYGHKVYAVGGNSDAAHLAGINTKNVVTLAFVVAGCLNAVAGIVMAGRLGCALSTAGSGLEMNALSGLVIGGTSMKGGKGNIIGTLLGCLIIGTLTNGLNLLNVSAYWTDFVRGLVIFLAITFDAIRWFMKKE